MTAAAGEGASCKVAGASAATTGDSTAPANSNSGASICSTGSGVGCHHSTSAVALAALLLAELSGSPTSPYLACWNEAVAASISKSVSADDTAGTFSAAIASNAGIILAGVAGASSTAEALKAARLRSGSKPIPANIGASSS